jgi:hypothetical protein
MIVSASFSGTQPYSSSRRALAALASGLGLARKANESEIAGLWEKDVTEHVFIQPLEPI